MENLPEFSQASLTVLCNVRHLSIRSSLHSHAAQLLKLSSGKHVNWNHTCWKHMTFFFRCTPKHPFKGLNLQTPALVKYKSNHDFSPWKMPWAAKWKQEEPSTQVVHFQLVHHWYPWPRISHLNQSTFSLRISALGNLHGGQTNLDDFHISSYQGTPNEKQWHPNSSTFSPPSSPKARALAFNSRVSCKKRIKASKPPTVSMILVKSLANLRNFERFELVKVGRVEGVVRISLIFVFYCIYCTHE